MANTISTMAINPFKGLVSKQRKRYQKDGFNLDLTYIQPNLIAMGFPAEKLESVYRNDIYDVKKFLEIHHPNKYKVYNLCSERKYDPNRFEHFSYYPFDDHNPPNIKLIRDFCDDVQKWLSADTQNVAAVHCKAGKGRTGTMICCYLLHVGTFSTADEALNCYGQERTHDKKGVTIPSQRRYVDYYAYLLKSEKQYSPVSLQICELKLSPPPLLNSNQGTIYFSISDTQKKIHCAPIPDFKKSDPYVLIKLDQCIPLVGDIKVEFCQRKKLCKDKLFHFWFNTFFVDELAEVQEDKRLVYSLAKCELDDAHKDKSCKIFVQDFKVEVVMHKIESGTFSNPYKLQMGLGLGQEKIHASTKSNNCHQKNNSFSNHILASLSGNNGKNHNLVLSPCSVVAGGIENNFPPDHHLGLGSMGIDVVDCPNSATATAAAAQDAIRTPSEGNSETLSSSSEPSLSGEEWESGELLDAFLPPIASSEYVDVESTRIRIGNAPEVVVSSCCCNESNDKKSDATNYKPFYNTDDNYYCGSSLSSVNAVGVEPKILSQRKRFKAKAQSSQSDPVISQKMRWLANMRSDPEFRETFTQNVNFVGSPPKTCETTKVKEDVQVVLASPQVSPEKRGFGSVPKDDRKSPAKTDFKRFFSFSRRESGNHDKVAPSSMSAPPSPPPGLMGESSATASAPIPIIDTHNKCDMVVVTPPTAANRAARCAPFSFRDIKQEIQSALKNHQQNSSKLKENKK